MHIQAVCTYVIPGVQRRLTSTQCLVKDWLSNKHTWHVGLMFVLSDLQNKEIVFIYLYYNQLSKLRKIHEPFSHARRINLTYGLSEVVLRNTN